MTKRRHTHLSATPSKIPVLTTPAPTSIPLRFQNWQCFLIDEDHCRAPVFFVLALSRPARSWQLLFQVLNQAVGKGRLSRRWLPTDGDQGHHYYNEGLVREGVC